MIGGVGSLLLVAWSEKNKTLMNCPMKMLAFILFSNMLLSRWIRSPTPIFFVSSTFYICPEFFVAQICSD